jgi:tetratricopeptide (TPR) repeat protein
VIDIVVREVSTAQDGSFNVRVDFGDGGGGEMSVSVPDVDEELLAWYFQEHLRYPILDKDREHEAASLIGRYGEALFRQVFSGEAAFGYRRTLDNGFDDHRLVIRGSASFHQLHWEALRDPNRDVQLALRMPLVRQDARHGLAYHLPDQVATLNILVVTARPLGYLDVGYRTISQPMIEAIGRTDMPVTIDLVRPGTWEALEEVLRASKRERGPGWYQVIHFDVHGKFGTPAAMKQTTEGRRYLFDPAVASNAGRQGFLFFETGIEGKTRPVSSSQVARLLTEHRVAVAVLNACQSAMQNDSEASLAQDLVAAGAPVAIGMAYSVSISAAERAMPVLYGRLAAGDDPQAAAFEARRALHDAKTRRGYFQQSLDLEDWILPVVFAQRDSRLQLREMTHAESEAFYQRRNQISVSPAVEYGFVGRDLDLYALERQLLIDPQRTQVLVRGMAGVGKSALLAHAGWWWQRTGLVDHVFAFSYEQRAWTAEQIVRHIGKHLLSETEFSRWETTGPAARTGLITDRLRGARHLVVIDNTESVTAARASIPHALPEQERGELARFLAGLRGGRTLVLVGSREAETWLAPQSFADNTYELPGLDPEAASSLLERILRRQGGMQWVTDKTDERERQALKDLMALLGGYPLPMTVILAQLAASSPSAVLDGLQAGHENADPTMAVRRAIEYSYGKLDPRLQDSLLLLAPFVSSIPASRLGGYADVLRAAAGAPDVEDSDLSAAVEELLRVGLATTHPTVPEFVQVVPVLPYVLRNHLGDQPVLAAAVDQAHYEFYLRLGPVLDHLMTAADPGRQANGRAGVAAEYANLMAAVAYGQRKTQPVFELVRPLVEYLSHLQEHQTCRQLLDDAIARHPGRNDRDQRRELGILHSFAGAIALAQLRLNDAYTHHQEQLVHAEALGDQIGTASAHGQLGNVAFRQELFDSSQEHFRRALEIYKKLKGPKFIAGTHSSLGMVAQKRHRFTEANKQYQKALKIFSEFQDWYNVARTYHNLGGLAMEEGDPARAEGEYRRSLEICLKESGFRHDAALTYLELGMLAHGRRDSTAAERLYRQALDIFMEFDDRINISLCYHQIGLLSAGVGRHAEAVNALLHAAASSYSSTLSWPAKTLILLRREKDQVPDGPFEQAVLAIIPSEAQKEFTAALDQNAKGRGRKL